MSLNLWFGTCKPLVLVEGKWNLASTMKPSIQPAKAQNICLTSPMRPERTFWFPYFGRTPLFLVATQTVITLYFQVPFRTHVKGQIEPQRQPALPVAQWVRCKNTNLGGSTTPCIVHEHFAGLTKPSQRFESWREPLASDQNWSKRNCTTTCVGWCV